MPTADPLASPADAHDLLAFIEASPSPYHCAAEAAHRLEAGGFRRLDEREPWPVTPGDHLIVRGGALVAWRTTGDADPLAGLRLLGAHTDSPNLRLRPRPDRGRHGYRQLGVDVYGGALVNSWLDRDLGLSGRVSVRIDGDVTQHLVRIDEAIARIPQLAIHLDRTIATDGLRLDPQRHLVPVWGLGDPAEGDLLAAVAARLDVDPDAIEGVDLMLHDVQPGAIVGIDRTMVASARLDNQLSAWAGTQALLRASGADHAPHVEVPVPVLCLFDHEEVGSVSATGAASGLLPTIIERICLAAGLDREGLHRALAASVCVSADGAHATHPNYAERHEPGHHIDLAGGPVLKHNANVRYASDALGVPVVRAAAARAGVPLQDFVVRGDLPCGSTIGPVTAAGLGIPTVDVGVAQLGMHSIRELCGRSDAERFVPLLAAFLSPAA